MFIANDEKLSPCSLDDWTILRVHIGMKMCSTDRDVIK
jgi:hypothetical protein